MSFNLVDVGGEEEGDGQEGEEGNVEADHFLLLPFFLLSI